MQRIDYNPENKNLLQDEITREIMLQKALDNAFLSYCKDKENYYISKEFMNACKEIRGIFGIPEKGRTALLELLKYPGRDYIRNKASVFAKLFPELTLWKSLRDKMITTNTPVERIAVLEEAINQGFLLKVENIKLLHAFDMAYPEIIKYFLDHESCTESHVKYFNTQFLFFPGYTELILAHPKLPKHAYCYSLHDHILDGFDKQKMTMMHSHRLEFIKLFFENKLYITDGGCLNRLLVDVVKVNEEALSPLAGEVLVHICRHQMFDSWVQKENYWDNFANDAERYPLCWAAIHGNKELLNLFYSTYQIPDDVNKMVMDMLKNNNHLDLVSNTSCHVIAAKQKTNVLTFYMGMLMVEENPQLPRDVTLHIIRMLMKESQQKYLASVQETGEPPQLYKNKKVLVMNLFARPVIAQSIVTKAKLGINAYLQDKPSSSGKNRAIYLRDLLDHYSYEFGMFCLYAILKEKTYYESRIKAHLLKFIGEDIDTITNAAKDYAQKNNFKLDALLKNLIALIHRGEKLTYVKRINEDWMLSCRDITFFIGEDDLLKKIDKNAELKTAKAKK